TGAIQYHGLCVFLHDRSLVHLHHCKNYSRVDFLGKTSALSKTAAQQKARYTFGEAGHLLSQVQAVCQLTLN
ncbi:hypothetical protein BSZ31_11495, partial [Limnobacter sp. SAORIC-690]